MRTMALQPTSEMRGRLLTHEPLARHCTWRVGGPADRYYEPADLSDLAHFVAGLPAEEPLLWLGFGSNLLVRDGGWRGTVVAVGAALGGYAWTANGRLRAEAGLACARVARLTALSGFTGAEFMAGIPGTLGGALAMNAGAYGGETWRLVASVETLDRSGRLHHRGADDFTVAYRSVSGPDGEWFVAAELQLEPDVAASAASRIEALLAQRAAAQPIGKPTCGSVFRNPPGDHAGRLIDAAGLKGCRIGGATVSDRHANFIITASGATAADVEALVCHIQSVVEQRFGLLLQPEVRIVGEPE